jgi:hypothetical protein
MKHRKQTEASTAHAYNKKLSKVWKSNLVEASGRVMQISATLRNMKKMNPRIIPLKLINKRSCLTYDLIRNYILLLENWF